MLSLYQYKTRKETENGWNLSDTDWQEHYRQYMQGYDSIPLPGKVDQGAVTRERARQAGIIERAKQEELARLSRIESDTKEANEFAKDKIDREAKREKELLAKTDEELRREKLKTCETFYTTFPIDEWPQWVREYYVGLWKDKYSYMSRKQKYEALMSNSYDPWQKLNNCLKRTPVNPSDKSESQYNIDMYYDFAVPECGMEWDWYNTPVANNVGFGIGLYTEKHWSTKFEIPSAAAEVGILGRKIADGADDAYGKFKWPAFFSGTVVMFVAAAVVAIKLL